MTNMIECPHCHEQVDGDVKVSGKTLKEILITDKEIKNYEINWDWQTVEWID